jgi:hypothetical protein
VLDAIAGSPRAGEYTTAISAADVDATAALSSYEAMQYRPALISARSAYERLLAVVDELRIPFDATNWHGDVRTPSDVRSDLREAIRELTRDPHEALTNFQRVTGTELTTQRIDGR